MEERDLKYDWDLMHIFFSEIMHISDDYSFPMYKVYTFDRSTDEWYHHGLFEFYAALKLLEHRRFEPKKKL